MPSSRFSRAWAGGHTGRVLNEDSTLSDRKLWAEQNQEWNFDLKRDLRIDVMTHALDRRSEASDGYVRPSLAALNDNRYLIAFIADLATS